jgi:hypothetical protein
MPEGGDSRKSEAARLSDAQKRVISFFLLLSQIRLEDPPEKDSSGEEPIQSP